MDDPRETLETSSMSDRQLSLAQYHLLCEVNGSVKKLWEDMYGDKERTIRGIKEQAQEHTLYIDRQRTGMKTLVGIVGVLGLSNLVTLGMLLAGLIG